MKKNVWLFLLLLNVSFLNAQTLEIDTNSNQPEQSSITKNKKGWFFSKMAVASANPLATKAGYQILQAGGNAIDAAVAVQLVLNLVEPQSSGIGGGAFLLHFDGRQIQAWNGRETAPAGAHEHMFLQQGQAMPFMDAVVSGLSVGVPGTLRMLDQAHQKQGKLAWSKLIQPAIQLAKYGFAVSERLNTLLKNDTYLKNDAQSFQYFYQANGEAWPVGHRLKNPGFAEILQRIAKKRSAALHEGEVAKAIVQKIQTHPLRPGTMQLADLKNYQPKLRESLCFDYSASQKIYRICGFPPPSSGLLTMGQIMGMLENKSIEWLTNETPNTWQPNALHAYIEASRLAYADRAMYIADPDFVQAPVGDWSSLISKKYLQERSALITDQRASQVNAGQPFLNKTNLSPMMDQPEFGTSHLSIIDAKGHAISMTTTIENGFGSRQMVSLGKKGGFLLNNELTDFSFLSHDAQGVPIANRVAAGKRPRSSMNPVLVFDVPPNGQTGSLQMSLGSPGGAAIIHYTTQTLLAMLHSKLWAQDAINLPHLGVLSPNGPVYAERGMFSKAQSDILEQKGHRLIEVDLSSGIQALQRTPKGWHGGADPRREGWVMGQ